MPDRTPHDRAPRSATVLTDKEVEVLRLQLLELAPRLTRAHLLDLADTLHDIVRDRRDAETPSFDPREV
ncbi:hypothetical protein ACFPIF_09425 [Brevundimonas faecalis]|uniref:hypothetical protein n=1 Tax=Brevundimonas faecalis TaxID=947378 RepID=UPI003605D599